LCQDDRDPSRSEPCRIVLRERVFQGRRKARVSDDVEKPPALNDDDHGLAGRRQPPHDRGLSPSRSALRPSLAVCLAITSQQGNRPRMRVILVVAFTCSLPLFGLVVPSIRRACLAISATQARYE
jgi:hypothetical protein